MDVTVCHDTVRKPLNRHRGSPWLSWVESTLGVSFVLSAKEGFGSLKFSSFLISRLKHLVSSRGGTLGTTTRKHTVDQYVCFCESTLSCSSRCSPSVTNLRVHFRLSNRTNPPFCVFCRITPVLTRTGPVFPLLLFS